METLVGNVSLSRTEGLRSVWRTTVEGFFWRPGQGLFTGVAQEMQKAVVSDQRVVGSHGCWLTLNQARRRRLNSCGAALMAPQ
jgi:hypothetical protein